jgi:hypothetical protein
MLQRGSGRRGVSAGAARLHSVAALLKERAFEGSFEAGGKVFAFTYSPSKAELAGRRLVLLGRLAIKNARGEVRVRDRVRALLAAVQGGIGAAPPRPRVAAAGQQSSVPVTESTGPLSFTGVMYFQFEPLEGRALGVPADLSRLQLNARLAPVDATARAIHGLYSSIVDSLYGDEPDDRAARELIGELNRTLGRG